MSLLIYSLGRITNEIHARKSSEKLVINHLIQTWRFSVIAKCSFSVTSGMILYTVSLLVLTSVLSSFKKK